MRRIILWAVVLSVGVAIVAGVCMVQPTPAPATRSTSEVRKDLSSPDPQVRAAAAKELGERMGKEEKP